jgi:hypothetical protein
VALALSVSSTVTMIWFVILTVARWVVVLEVPSPPPAVRALRHQFGCHRP